MSKKPKKPRRKPKPEYIVYGLVDPRTLGVEYIGQSSSGVARARVHRTPTSLRYGNTKNVWLRELFAAGLDYDIVTLGSVKNPKAPGTLCWWREGCNTTALNDLEIWHIAMGRAMGWTLKNSTNGGEGNPGRVCSDAQRERVRETSTEYHNRPEVKKAASARITKRLTTPEARAASSEWSRRRWEDPEYQEMMSTASSAYHNRPDVVASFGDRLRAWWDDPEYRAARVKQSRERAIERCRDPEYRRGISDRAKASWTDEMRAALAQRNRDRAKKKSKATQEP